MDLAVLVPVLDRPQNVAPLVESFLANCPGDSKLLFILSLNDAAEANEIMRFVGDRIRWTESGYGSWPRKVNLGVDVIDADWYLCAADDVRFTEGWWDATQRHRATPTVGVIGTNDSATGRGNPRVASGEHTCHPLVRGSYIRDRGTVDQPGCAVHPGYHHWFVDDELVWTAKSRGAWAFCREAVVEHLHPYWGGGEWDATYAKGEANADADRELWARRAPLLGLVVQ